jgi:hypothetical protein
LQDKNHDSNLLGHFEGVRVLNGPQQLAEVIEHADNPFGAHDRVVDIEHGENHDDDVGRGRENVLAAEGVLGELREQSDELLEATDQKAERATNGVQLAQLADNKLFLFHGERQHAQRLGQPKKRLHDFGERHHGSSQRVRSRADAMVHFILFCVVVIPALYECIDC